MYMKFEPVFYYWCVPPECHGVQDVLRAGAHAEQLRNAALTHDSVKAIHTRRVEHAGRVSAALKAHQHLMSM